MAIDGKKQLLDGCNPKRGLQTGTEMYLLCQESHLVVYRSSGSIGSILRNICKLAAQSNFIIIDSVDTNIYKYIEMHMRNNV